MSTPGARTPRICLLAIGIASLNIAAQAEQPLPTHPNALPGAVPADTFAVTMTVTLQLSSLHPAATQGGLLCGAEASFDSNLATLQAKIQSAAQQTTSNEYNQTFSGLLSNAHYHHSDAYVTFPIVNRGYSGTQTVTMYVANAELINPQTNAVWPSPAVLVGCWLTINGTPALYASQREVATANNINHVTTSTIVAVQVANVSTQ